MNMLQRRNLLSMAIVGALALGLSACGGGGGGVRETAPPPTTPSTPGFTPTIPIDASLTNVTPPTVAAEAAPATFADSNLARMHVLINSAGALGAGKVGTGVTIGFVDSGVNRNHPSLTGRVLANFVHVGSGNDLSVDDKVGHGTNVASLAAGKAMQANYLTQDASGNYTVSRTSTWPGGVAQGAGVVSSRIIADAPQLDRPLMLIHGFSDDNVTIAHSLRLSQALMATGRKHTFLPLTGITHMTNDETVAENLLILQRDFLAEALG